VTGSQLHTAVDAYKYLKNNCKNLQTLLNKLSVQNLAQYDVDSAIRDITQFQLTCEGYVLVTKYVIKMSCRVFNFLN